MDAFAALRLPPAVQSAWYGLSPYSFFDRARRRHGDIFTIRILGERWTVVADPAVVRELFTGDPEILYSGEANLPLRGLIGTGNLLLLDGDKHLRRRKLLLPPFHGERMQAYGRIMADATDRELSAWPTGRAGPSLVHTQAITFEVIMRAVFGVEEGQQMGALGTALRDVLDWAQSARTMVRFALRGPEALVTHPPFLRRIAPVDREIHAEIARRRGDPDLEQRTDILSLLLQARYEDGTGLPDADVRDELVTLLVAGHETTASTLAWAIHFVARDPGLQEWLAAKEEGLAEAVVQETLRLRPAVPLVVRLLKAPMVVAGRTLPAGTRLTPSSLLIHRDPAIYPEPLTFRPDRFLGTKPGTYDWIPFGGGVRRCIGAAFAQMEARVVLERLTERFTITPYRAQAERVGRRGIVLIPHRHGRVVLEPR
jgi:cytochrome P450